MIPKINDRGHSFKGVIAYLMHDKEMDTSERVTWSETGNMHTNDLEKAAKVMAWVDKNADVLKRDFGGSTAGKKTEAGAVYHYSLSWAQSEQPDAAHQREEGLKTLEQLGLDKHQYIMVAHNDTDHAHIHIVANLTNPDTGKRHVPSFDKRELQSYALGYEREHEMHCHQREENAAKRERGEFVKHRDTKQDYSDKVTRAYYAADSGKAFIHALGEEGLNLAAARRGNGFVIVDEKGDIQKLARQLDIEEKGKAKTFAINAKLSDIDRDELIDADQLSKDIRLDNTRQPEIYDRDADEVKRQKDLEEAAHKAGAEKARLQEQKEAREAAALRAEALLKKQALQKRARYEKAQSARFFQEKIDEKTAASKKKWQIDELTKARASARAEYQKSDTRFNRIFRRGKVEEARDHLRDMDKRLKERRGRLLDDIEAFNKNRPEWAREKELEKHGFKKPKVPTHKPAQDHKQAEAQNVKEEKARGIVREDKTRPKTAMRRATSPIDDKVNIQEKAASPVKKPSVQSGKQIKRNTMKNTDAVRAEFNKMRKEQGVEQGANDNEPNAQNLPKNDIEM